MNSIDMKKMINIKECLKHLALLAMFLLVNGSVFAQTEPADDEVFDLVAYEDSTGSVKFKNGNDSIGYLRMPNGQDPSYYIFTNKKYIRVSIEGDIKVKTSVQFDSLIIDNKYKKGDKKSTYLNSERPRGYYVLGSGLETFELLEGKKFKIAYSEETYHDNTLLTIRMMSGKEISSMLNQDTICFMAGDTIKSFRVKRERRGLIDKILFNDERLAGTYKLSDNPFEYSDDDIVYTVASFTVIDEKVLSNEVICFPLEVHLRYLKDGNLEPVVKKVMIKVEKEEEKAGGMIPLWGFVVLFIVGVALFVVLTLILIRRNKNDKKKKDKKKEKNPEDGKGGFDGNPNPLNEDEQIFEKISNEEAAKLLLDLCGEKSVRCDSDDLVKKAKRLWIKKFCKKWNDRYKDSDFCIDEDKFAEDFIFENIENWKKQVQNDAHKDGYNEALQELSKNAQGLNWDINALKQEKEKTRYDIQLILTAMSENHFPVKTTTVSSIKDGLKAIEQAIEEGAQQNELQQKITELEGHIAAQKESYEQQLSEMGRNHQQALDDKDRTHKEQMAAQKEGYERQLTEKDTKRQQALDDKDKTHQEQMDAKETAHQEELNSLNQTHADTIANLNETIQTKDTEIAQLKIDGHQDCISFVNMVVKRMNGVGDLLNELYENVYLVSGERETQYTNILRKAKEDYELFVNQVTEANAGDKWLQIGVSLTQVCEDLQTYVTSGLRNSGWVNIVHYLNLYAGTTEKLNDSFNENGLSTIKLAKLVADIQRLLGMFGVKVVVPHLLMDKFDDKAFDFENADRWIQAFASDLKPNDYEARVFDMSVIGYQMDDRRYNKPRVFYS